MTSQSRCGSVLNAREIRAAYAGGADVLHGMSLELRAGELLAIAGPNGAGKSTLLKVLSGALKPRTGQVTILGDDLASLGRKAISRRIATVGQEGGAAFPFTVLEGVLMGRAPHLAPLRFEGDHDVEIAIEAMRRFGIEELAHRFIQELSGGERKRVFLARALSQQPAVMLLDEPTAFLDLKHVARIFEVFRELRAERGLAIIATLHDLNAAAEYADRLMLVKDGAIVASGSPSEILTEKTLRSVYETGLSIGKNPATGSIAIFPSPPLPLD